MIETWTSPFNNQKGALRAERGRWNERQYFEFIFDDVPRDDNMVSVNAANPRLAQTTFHGYSDYARRAAARIPQMLDKMSEALPIERTISVTETVALGHIQGTTVMGSNPEDSIIDRNLVHHQIRNLLVLGSGAFPTATPVSPTLTLSAMSLLAADNLLNKGS
jgi:choline dehydrogenase-like flavoprotein